MKICIVDDEKSCVDNLHSLLFYYAKENNIDLSFDVFSDGPSFLSEYSPEVYDIIFLDIYIGETTGMDVAAKIREQSENCMIIFCTTSLNDMPEAFRYHAFEYIIKPAEYDRIKKIMDDAIAVLPNLEKFIDLTSPKESLHIALSDLLSITSSGHYLEITTRDKSVHTVRMTMTEFKALLNNDSRFLDINKGILINMDHIKNIQDRTCTMDTDATFPIKVRASNSIRKEWQNYTFEKIRRGQKNRI